MPKALRDLDTADQVFLAKVVAWAAGPGLLFGGFAGYKVAEAWQWSGALLLLGVFGGSVLGVVLLSAGAWGLVNLVSSSTRHLYAPSGRSTPAVRDYSFAASLVARGRLDEAIEAYEAATREFPRDPEPYLRLARLLRDRLGRHEDAAEWFKRARLRARMDAGAEILVTREIIELYQKKLNAPGRAFPELARLAGKFPETPAGEWAKAELEAARQELRGG